MRRENTIRLDTHFLTRRIEVLGYKQSWVADRVGVARKTVSRWATGKVKRIDAANAEALAEVLRCPVDELISGDEVLATKEEQKNAARLIQENDLLQLLSPSDSWPLAESLIKASLQPDLPLADVGRLHNLLSIASWRQGKYEEAGGYARRAREIGERAGEKSVVVGALYNLAVIDSLCGNLADALATYERCLERPERFETMRDHAKVLSNVGDAYRSFMRYPESIEAQEKSIELFGRLDLDLNLAISCVSLGYCLGECGRHEEAGAAFARGEEHAARANYTRGVDCAPIYRAGAMTFTGDAGEASALVVGALPKLSDHAVYDLGCHAIAARVFRRAGDLAAAREQLEEGLRRSEPFPELLGTMSTESARLALAIGDIEEERVQRERANEAHRRAGLDVRVTDEVVREYGDGPSGDPA